MHSGYVLTMSGGGASSLAYAGFVDVLREHDVLPRAYAGLSGGALFAVLLSSGFTSDQMVAFIEGMKSTRMLGFHPHHFEIIDHHAMETYIKSHLPYKTFEALPTPVVIFASDLGKQVPVAITTGDIASAIVGSCSVFPWFQPVKRRGSLLGDGGFTTYYGAQFLHELGYKRVVGVDVTGISEGSFKGILHAWFAQVNASVTSNARYELVEHPVDVDIRIQSLSPSFLSMKHHAHRLLLEGRKAGKEHIHAIKKLVTA